MFKDLVPIENEGQRILLTKQLAEFYGTVPDVITNNFNRNKEHFKLGKHYYSFEGEEKKNFLNLNKIDDGSLKFTKTLYLWTQKGALLHAKSINTDEAWDVYDELVESYFRKHDNGSDYSTLSPQLQYLIQLEQEQNRQKEQIKAVEQKVESIKELVSLNPTAWRKECRTLINKIVNANGGNYSEVNNEIYKLFDARAGVNLHQRLDNRKDRMIKEGVCKSKVNNTNIVDVIAEENRLIEIYIKIVSEMAIKHGVY